MVWHLTVRIHKFVRLYEFIHLNWVSNHSSMPNPKQYLRDRGHPSSWRTESSLGRKTESSGKKRHSISVLLLLSWRGGKDHPHGKAQKEGAERTTLAKFKTKGRPGKTRERVPGQRSGERRDSNPPSSRAQCSRLLHRRYSEGGINVEKLGADTVQV